MTPMKKATSPWLVFIGLLARSHVHATRHHLVVATIGLVAFWIGIGLALAKMCELIDQRTGAGRLLIETFVRYGLAGGYAYALMNAVTTTAEVLAGRNIQRLVLATPTTAAQRFVFLAGETFVRHAETTLFFIAPFILGILLYQSPPAPVWGVAISSVVLALGAAHVTGVAIGTLIGAMPGGWLWLRLSPVATAALLLASLYLLYSQTGASMAGLDTVGIPPWWPGLWWAKVITAWPYGDPYRSLSALSAHLLWGLAIAVPVVHHLGPAARANAIARYLSIGTRGSCISRLLILFRSSGNWKTHWVLMEIRRVVRAPEDLANALFALAIPAFFLSTLVSIASPAGWQGDLIEQVAFLCTLPVVGLCTTEAVRRFVIPGILHDARHASFLSTLPPSRASILRLRMLVYGIVAMGWAVAVAAAAAQLLQIRGWIVVAVLFAAMSLAAGISTIAVLYAAYRAMPPSVDHDPPHLVRFLPGSHGAGLVLTLMAVAGCIPYVIGDVFLSAPFGSFLPSISALAVNVAIWLLIARSAIHIRRLHWSFP